MAILEIEINADLVFNKTTDDMSDNEIITELKDAFDTVLNASEYVEEEWEQALMTINKFVGSYNHTVTLKEEG